MVDSVSARHIIELGSTEPADYAAGTNSFSFKTPSVDVSGIKPSRLANAGLLTASLTSDGTEVMDLNMVVQVTKEGDEFVRTVYNPLE